MSITPPPILETKQHEIVERLQRMVPHFVPEWSAPDEDPGTALVKIFSFLTRETLDRLNQTPKRNMLAFLDLLGIRLLPKTPAKAFLCFRVSDGAPGFIDIPARTLATAASDTGELPFETDEPIRANPGKLAGIFAVDPGNDAIYQPPRGFLEKEFIGPSPANYETTAFSSAGSQSIQLQLVDGIEPGDTLRIGENDFVVVEINGLIVQPEQVLPVDVNAQTKVYKRTTFELFKGINRQEHILYLSHPEYFTLKEKTIITLEVKVTQTGDAAEVAWEYLTEYPETKTTDWAKLTVGRDDTKGLSRGGIIELLKPKGEIKEADIGGQTGRWIRARRANPIGLLNRPSTLDSVEIRVAAGASVAAEAGFYNESPLPVGAPPFNPLGFEPQLFDRFQVASDEAFSKHGAEVTLDFRLDESRLLGAPSVAVGNDSMPRVFARGVLTRLVEVSFIQADFEEIQKAPSPPAPGTVPAVVSEPGSNLIGVFVRCQDDSIQLFKSATSTAPEGWTNLEKPDGKQVKLDPGAVFAKGEWNVFVAADGKLWRKGIPTSGGSGSAWTALSDLTFKPASAAAAALDNGGNPVVFAFDENNKLWRIRWATGEWEVQVPEPLPSATLTNQDQYQCESAASAHPFALNGVSSAFPLPAVFFRNKLGEIVGVRTDTELQNLGTPTGIKASADPCCIVDFSVTNQLLVFAPFGEDDRQLYSTKIPAVLVGVLVVWGQRANPQPVAGRPFAVSLFGSQCQVFAASGQSSMMRLTLRTGGSVQAGPTELMLFAAPAPAGNDRHVRLPNESPAQRPHELNNTFPDPTVAVFKQPLTAALDENTPYQLLELVEDDLVIASVTSLTEIELDSETTTTSPAGLFLSVEESPPQFVEMDAVSSGEKTIKLAQALTSLPAANTECKIFRLLAAGNTPASALNRVLLDANASTEQIAYKGARIHTGGSITLITEYDGPKRIAVLSETLPVTSGDLYSFPDQWVQLQDPSLDDIDPVLFWEYWNGSSWINLPLGKVKDPSTNVDLPKDDTDGLIRGGAVRFVVPDNIAPTEIAGQTNYWIRARLVGGNYGQVRFETKAVTAGTETTFTAERKDFSRPPIVTSLSIQYALTEFKPPKVLQTLNNLNYVDQTAASITLGKSFKPFLPIDSTEKAVYLGLQQRFSDPSLLLALQNDQPLDEKRKLDWEALFQNDFSRIEVRDDSGAFTHTGLVRLVAPFEPEKRQLFGIPAYWIRAKLREQDWPQSPELSGVFLNAVRAKQLRTVEEEILGGSDGTPQQRFQFQHTPVFEGEEIRVRTVLTDEDRDRIKAEAGDDAVFDIRDENQNVIETWVLWKEVTEFFDSKFDSRHYRLDRASGELASGDGRHGAIPPIGGDNIRAFQYRFGGGQAGNVGVNTIQSLVTAIGGIDAVTNPLPAGGGSEEATRAQMLDLGPAQLNHRDRAVSSTDYEWLALAASRDVVKAHCVPNRDDGGLYNPGWVSVYIVARSEDARPLPPLELCRTVRVYLLKKAPAVVGWQQHIFVGQPDYVPVSVTIAVEAASIALAAEAETKTHTALENFLHPLKGGSEKTGWKFGQGLAISALYAEIEKISAVEHVVSLSIMPAANGDEYLELQPNQILASGNHSVTVTAAEEAQAWR